MAGQADGSIIIDTELNSDGFKAGSAELLAAIKALSEEVKNLRNTLTDLFKKPLTPEVNTSSAEDQVAALEAQVNELEAAMEELRNAGQTGETAAPEINMGGTTQRASDLQRQIDAVNTSVERLEPTFQKAMSGSESAMTTFEGKASALETKIAQLREQLDAVGKTQYPTQGYEEITRQIEKAEQALFRLYEKQDKMQATGVSESSRQWQGLQYDIQAAKENLERYERAQAAMQANGTAFTMGVDTSQYAQMEATLQAAEQHLASMQGETAQLRNEVQQTNSAWAQMPTISGYIKNAFSSVASTVKSAFSTVGMAITHPLQAADRLFASILQKAGSLAKLGVQKLVSGLKAAASHMARMVFHSSSLKGQFSGLISSAKKFTLSLLGARGVYALLRKAVSAYMAENQQLANQLSACWSGIGNVLGPIITRLINLVAQAVAYVTSFLKLFGVFSKGATKAISKAGGAASGAAKELKRQLAAFDELNILSDNSSDSGGGGGGAGDIGAELPDVTLPDWAKLMVEQLKAGDWEGAATTLAEQLNKMVASVDWAGIGQKIGYYLNGALTFLATFIKKFDWKALGSDLATMLNNIITSVDWGNLGTLLVAKFSILLQLLTGFFETFDGKAFGDGVYDLIMGMITACDWVGLTGQLSKNISKFITSINFEKIAQALSKGIRTILQSINSAVTNFDWAGVGGKIADFLNGIDWSGMFSDLVTLVGNLLVGALNLLNGFVKKVDWKKLADDLWKCLESLVTDIDWNGFGASLGEFLSNAVIGVLTFVGTLFTDYDWAAIMQDLHGILGTALGSMIQNIDWMGLLGTLTTALIGIIVQIPGIIVGSIGGTFDFLAALFEAVGLDSVAGFFKGLGDALRNVGTWLKENLVDPVVNWVKNLFGIHSPSTVFAEIGGYLIEGLLQGIKNAWQAIANFFTGAFEGLKNLISGAWEGIKSFTSTVWSGIKSGLSSAWNGIKTTASTVWNGLKTTVSTAWNNIKSWTSSTWSSIKATLSSTWNSIKTTAATTWNNLKSTVSTSWNNIKSTTATVWNGIKSTLSSTWNSVKSTASTTWNNLKSTISTGWNNIKSNTASTWSSIKSSLTTTWNNIKSTTSTTWNNLKTNISNGWNSIKSNTTATWNSIKSSLTSTWNNVKSTATTTWNNLKTNISNGWNNIKSNTNTTWSNIKSSLTTTWNTVKSTASTTWNNLKSSISTSWNNIKSNTTTTWNNLKSSLTSTWNNVKSTATNTWNSMKSTASNAWNSMKSTATSTWNGIKSTLSSTWNNIKSTASSTWSSMKSAASTAWDGMKNNATSTWNSIKSSLSSTWSNIKSTASSTWSGIKSTIENQGWSGVGTNICNGIANGINSGWTWLKNKVSSVAQSLLSAAKSALGIQSPSKLFRDEVGLNIGYGIGEGVSDSEPSIVKTVSGVADAIAEEMNAGDYAIKNIVPIKEVDGAMTNFTDTITDSFTSMLDKLQAIAKNVTFTAPAMAHGAIPYSATATAGAGSEDIGAAIETSNDELASVIVQTVTNATTAIVGAIQENGGTMGIPDANTLATSVIKEINRRTRMNGTSPLIR